MNMTAAERIKQKALELGFDKCGIAQALPLDEEYAHLKEWLASGYHGTMQWLENHAEKRINPSLLVPGAKSVVSLLLNYYPNQLQEERYPQIAKYAYGRDYHKVIKNMLKELYGWMEKELGASGRYFVDSAPVLERAWAMRAGIGWIGKNGCLINRDLGSFTFISEVICDLELDYDKPEFDRCGSCRKCIDDCPTQAIIAPQVLDASKCISYYTIEDRSEWTEGKGPQLSNRVYGCDICQDVCPWNRKAKGHHVADFEPKPERLTLDVAFYQQMNEEDYADMFFGTAMKRASMLMMKRNSKHI